MIHMLGQSFHPLKLVKGKCPRTGAKVSAGNRAGGKVSVWSTDQAQQWWRATGDDMACFTSRIMKLRVGGV